MSTRYFHGTTASLQPGDILLPGVQIGLTYHGRSEHVYGTSTSFDGVDLEWDEDQDTEPNRVSLAIDTAMEWASYAADMGGCTAESCIAESVDDPSFHYEVHLEGSWLPCIHVYEIEPLGEVSEDGSSDINASGVRMSSARIIRELSWADKPMFTY